MMKSFLIAVLALAAAVNALVVVRAGGINQPQQTIWLEEPTPMPVMPPFPFSERLAPPPTVYPPTQADEGAQVYYLVCMACHGDKGQGLTEEWRNVLSPEERNCWQSKCHASNHPPEGFKLPEYIPPVVGPNLITAFGNAANLHSFLKARMPWQAPGTLSEDEYWQLTAFLIRENGIFLGTVVLGEDNAKLFSLMPAATSTAEPAASSLTVLLPAGNTIWVLFGTAILVIGALAFGAFWIRHSKEGQGRSGGVD